MTVLDFDSAGEVLDSQPFSRLIGVRLTAFEPGVAELTIAVRLDLLQQFNFVHGGVLSYAADNALTLAGGSALGAEVVTRGFAIDYLRPAQGETVVARARVVSSSRRSALCRCEVTSGGKIVAAAQGSIARIEL